MNDKEMILVNKKKLYDGLITFIALTDVADGRAEAEESAVFALALSLGFDEEKIKDFVCYSAAECERLEKEETNAE